MTRRHCLSLVMISGLLLLFGAGCVVFVSPQPQPTYTLYPTYTPYPTLAPHPTPTYFAPTPTRDRQRVTQWAVYAAPANDVNVILLNGHIVAATYCCREKPGWVDIDDRLRHDPFDELTFVNLNGPGYGDWGFQIWHDNEIVWKNVGLNEQENTLGYVQAVQIKPDNTLQLVTSTVTGQHLAGQWTVRIAAEDVGLILVNNIPVAGSYSGGAKAPESPTPGLVDSGWIDIGNLLHGDQNNTISVVVWNRAGPYHWQAFVRRGEEVIWERSVEGQDRTGEVFSTSLVISEDGEALFEH